MQNFNLDWVDLPHEPCDQVLGYDSPNVQRLKFIINKYIELPKDQEQVLSSRILVLDQVVDHVQKWIEDGLGPRDKKKHLLWLSGIAARKRNYIGELRDLYATGRYLETHQARFHADPGAASGSGRIVVCLSNHRFFSLKQREYWGDFWYEAMDPCHRRLTPFLDQWRAVRERDPGIPHFFLWLETQHIPHYVPRVTYLAGTDLEACRVRIEDGLLWTRAGEGWAPARFEDPARRYLFALDLGTELFVREEEPGISHTSLTSGKAVLGAGLLRTKAGRLNSIILESGHFMPTVEVGFQILELFKARRAALPETLELVFFHDRNKYRAELDSEDRSSLERFRRALDVACSRQELYEGSTDAK